MTTKLWSRAKALHYINNRKSAQQRLPAAGRLRPCKRLQAQVLFGGGRSGLAWQWRPDDASVFIELHAQREAHLHQYILDLVERFAAEVLGLKHFVFALLHQFANRSEERRVGKECRSRWST